MGTYRRRYQTDIVVVGWNHLDLTARCLESIQKNTPPDLYQITYIDNGSDSFDLALDSAMNFVRLPFNHGYVRGCNVGMAMSLLSDSEYILLLNNDAWIPDRDTTWLQRLMEPMQYDKAAGAVGAVSDNVFGYQRRAERKKLSLLSYAPSLIGFCLLLRKSAVMKVGLLDERYEPGNFDDFDYSLRLTEAGYKLAIAESVWIHHQMHATQGDLKENFSDLLETNKRKFIEKWGAEKAKSVGVA